MIFRVHSDADSRLIPTALTSDGRESCSKDQEQEQKEGEGV